MNTAEIIYERIKNLPEPLAREVLDFVNFIILKKERTESENLIFAQQTSLSCIWENVDDEGWKPLSEEETESAIGEMLKEADKATKP